MGTFHGLEELFSLVLAVSKDRVYQDSIERMQAAFQELILAEADARRLKTEALIRKLAKIDVEIIRFKREYERIAGQLTPADVAAVDGYLKLIEQKRKEIAQEKNALKTKR